MHRLRYDFDLPTALTWLVRLKRAERMSADKLRAVQQRRLTHIVDHARTHSPFYRELYRGHDHVSLERLGALPSVTKAAVMDRFDDVVTDRSINRRAMLEFAENPSNLGRLFKGRYVLARTSGTTGLVGHYVHDLFSYFLCFMLTTARSRGVSWKSWLAAGSRPTRFRIASVLSPAANLGVASVIASAPKFVRMASDLRLYDIFRPWGETIDALNRFQPHVIGSFPTILEQLAESQLEGKLRLRPQAVRSGGETLAPRVRARLAEAFQCNVYDCYGCAETGWVGMECDERNGLHVFADWFLVEPVDDEGHPVPPGVESAKIYLTNLANYVQPFIRFELSDRVTLIDQPCPCGSVLPRILLKGRASEVLRFPAGVDTVRVPPFHLTTLAEMVAGIQRYQIVQEADTNLTVLFTARRDADAATVERTLRTSFETYLAQTGLAPAVSVAVRMAETVERDPSGKIRQVLSRLPN
jgi:phenylacetate-coenzyme A ligase PaaK-like adenylate-forming protein